MKLKQLSTKLIIILIAFFTSFCNVPIFAEEIEENNNVNSEEIIIDEQTSELDGQEVVIEIEVVKTDDNEVANVQEETNVEVKEDIVEVQEDTVEVEDTVEAEDPSPDEQTESEVITDETENVELAQDVEDNTTISDTTDETSQTVLLGSTDELGQNDSALEDLIKDAKEVKDTSEKVDLYILDSSDNGGSNTYRSFVYTVKDDEGNLTYYKGYLSGDGVDDDTCLEFAFAASSGIDFNYTITNTDFVDSNKSSSVKYDDEGNVSYAYNVGYDSEHCWLKSTANALELTDWMKYADAGIFNTEDNNGLMNAGSYFEDEDDIADYLSYCFTDEPGFQISCLSWLFTGEAVNCADYLKYGDDLNDALLSSYFQEDICSVYYSGSIGNENFITKFNSDLNDLSENKGSIGLGIYFFKNNDEGEYVQYGGHAITLNGYIYQCTENNDNTIDYSLSNVIISDPDDSVRYAPAEPEGKPKNYILSSLSSMEKGKYVGLYNMTNYDKPFDSAIALVTCLSNSSNFLAIEDGQIKIIEHTNDGLIYKDPLSSITPTTTSAIKDDYYTSTTYDVEDKLNIGLNYDFLSFYDIDDIKYELKDEEGNTVKSGVFEYSKSTWNALLNSDGDFSLDFTNIIDDVGAGTYNLELSIDKDCFYGNYGWFANKSNYYSTLADILVNMHHKQIINNTSDNNDDDEDDSVPVVVATNNKVIINSIKVVSPTETLIKNNDGTYNRQISNSSNNKIQISSLSSLIPSGTTFNQELLNENSKEYEVIKKAIDSYSQFNLSSVSDYFAYNFDLTQSDGTEIHELDGYVEVSLPVPSDITIGANKNIVAYRVNDDGSLTKCDTKVVNNVIKFKTNHFSTYVFVVEEYATPLTSVTLTNKIQSLKLVDSNEYQNLIDVPSLAWCLFK